MRVILFSFYGRKPNIMLQLPFIRRILDEHLEAEFHIWNLARDKTDFFFIRYLVEANHISGERIEIHNENYHIRPHWMGYKAVFTHYTAPEYEDCLFIKLDDDIVFMQTARLDDFIGVIDDNRGVIVSADIINNGACSRLQSAIGEQFDGLGIPLLDWHLHTESAAIAHEYFFDNWRTVCANPVEVHPTEEWLSINCMGFDYEVMCAMHNGIGWIGEASLEEIAGRKFAGGKRGDEGVANMLPRVIVKGFTVAHLTYGPQPVPFEQLASWRENYAQIGCAYLDEHAVRVVGARELNPAS